jgi:hypothetical protein
VLWHDGSAEAEMLAPVLAGKLPLAGRAAAYVCRNFSCQAPLTDEKELKKELSKG